MSHNRYHRKNTSSGSQFPICFWEREKIRGILTSLEKSRLYDLETKVKKALWIRRLSICSKTHLDISNKGVIPPLEKHHFCSIATILHGLGTQGRTHRRGYLPHPWSGYWKRSRDSLFCFSGDSRQCAANTDPYPPSAHPAAKPLHKTKKRLQSHIHVEGTGLRKSYLSNRHRNFCLKPAS